MKAVLTWCAICTVVILCGLLFKSPAPMVATSILLLGGISLVVAVCWKAR